MYFNTLPKLKAVLFAWCGQRDLNPHSLEPDPKSKKHGHECLKFSTFLNLVPHLVPHFNKKTNPTPD